MPNLTELFCLVDDFCKVFEPQQDAKLIATGEKQRRRKTSLSLSELMTLVILFHKMRHRQFKMFYQEFVAAYLHREFPTLPSYQRCIELMPRCTIALFEFFQTIKGHCTGITFVDSTPIIVSHNLRIKRHKVFANQAARGKNGMGWYYGFKCHLAINHLGELLDFRLTPANQDDRPSLKIFSQYLQGFVIGDKGYLSAKLSAFLAAKNIQLLTPVRKNMKESPRTDFEVYLQRHRRLIETVNDQIKNLCQIEHSRHRSLNNFLVNFVAALIAYSLAPKKPKLPISVAYPLENLMTQGN